jgi:hypothetical protein
VPGQAIGIELEVEAIHAREARWLIPRCRPRFVGQGP